jgi:hypothetical protein
MTIGDYYLVNSSRSLENARSHLENLYKNHKEIYIKFYCGKRSLNQNSVKSIWYRDIAKARGDVTAKNVERECKYKYGLPIIRRDPLQNRVHEKLTDTLDYEWRLKIMDCFAVTSVMTKSELAEYLKLMKDDYPYLTFIGEEL